MGLNHDDLLRLLILVVNVASLEKAVFVYSKQVERFVRIQHSFPWGLWWWSCLIKGHQSNKEGKQGGFCWTFFCSHMWCWSSFICGCAVIWISDEFKAPLRVSMVIVLPIVHWLPHPHSPLSLSWEGRSDRRRWQLSRVPSLKGSVCIMLVLRSIRVYNLFWSRVIMAGSQSPFPGTEGGEWSRADSLDALGRAQQCCGPARHKDKWHIAARISILLWRRI